MADRHPQLPEDQVVLDWFAGATTAFAMPDPSRSITRYPDLDRSILWDGAEVALAMTDLGLWDGDPRAQLVLYAVHHDDALPGRGISLEIDRDDARKLAAALILWATAADDLKEAQE